MDGDPGSFSWSPFANTLVPFLLGWPLLGSQGWFRVDFVTTYRWDISILDDRVAVDAHTHKPDQADWIGSRGDDGQSKEISRLKREHSNP